MSLWENYLDNFSFKSLANSIEVDTLIIGGGLAGLTTLYYLKDLPSVCLVDANYIGSGVTKNTTGKLNYLQGSIYTIIKKNIHKETAISYLNSQKYAISLIKEIIQKEKIKCDLEQVDSFIFTNKEKEIKKLKQEKEFLESQKVFVEEKSLPLEIPSKYSIAVSDTYVFNPIKYLNQLKRILKDKQIYENTRVISIKYQNNKYYCYTEKHTIVAKKVIVACHYPFFVIPFLLPLKSYNEKSYIIACKTEKNNKFSCINISNPSLSLRYYQDGKNIYKICLASSHNTAIKQNDENNFNNVKKVFKIKEEDIITEWSNVDIITDDRLPYIGKIKKNLYIETGFNTWGMTNAILAAKIISDTILNIKNDYQKLFKIKRMNFYKFKSFFNNMAISVVAFIGSKKKKKSWYSENLQFKTINGKSVAIYTDKYKKEHIVYTTCPHFGCSLIFNKKEKTWDCPCHSSRFSIDGECIKGPSVKDIKYKE
ncbi:MAG: FAD-dependent oxidoreductase [Bacilli bacterium]